MYIIFGGRGLEVVLVFLFICGWFTVGNLDFEFCSFLVKVGVKDRFVLIYIVFVRIK